MAVGARLLRALIGEKIELPEDLIRRYPDLAQATYRRGGLPVRIGGWSLGMNSAAAITLWRTVFIAPNIALEIGRASCRERVFVGV